ncbi:MAG: hypothetical protein AABW88_04675 [Nanoarchaeota archaeon]
MNIQAISLEKRNIGNQYLICYWSLIKKKGQLFWEYRDWSHEINAAQIPDFMLGIKHRIFLGKFAAYQYDPIKCTEQHLEQLKLYVMSCP